MTYLSISLVFAALLVLAIGKRLVDRRSRSGESEFRVDDEAMDRILRHGTLSTPEEEPLDEAEIARAEQEFWEESWDEPEEYDR